jgi:hypothetical protein
MLFLLKNVLLKNVLLKNFFVKKPPAMYNFKISIWRIHIAVHWSLIKIVISYFGVMMFIKIYFQTFRPHQNSQGKTLILKYIFGRFLNMQQQNTACTAPVKKCFRNGRLYFLYFALWLPKFGWVNLWVKVYQLFNRKI